MIYRVRRGRRGIPIPVPALRRPKATYAVSPRARPDVVVSSLTSSGITVLRSAVRTAILDLVVEGPSGRVVLRRAARIPKPIPGPPLDPTVIVRAGTVQALPAATTPRAGTPVLGAGRVRRVVLGEIVGTPPTHYRFPDWWRLELRYWLRLEELFERLSFFLDKLEAKSRH